MEEVGKFSSKVYKLGKFQFYVEILFIIDIHYFLPNITVNLDSRYVEPGVYRFFRNSLYVTERAAFLQLIRVRKSKIEYSHSI